MTWAQGVYESLFRRAAQDPNVVGLVLGGSRGKRALVTPGSDYDVYLVVLDDPDEYRRRWTHPRGHPLDIAVFSLEEFRGHAAVGSQSEWNRYTFTHVEPELDRRDGEIGAIVRDKGCLPPEAARERAGEELDGYLNAYYRCLKNARLGLATAAQLDAAESVPPLLVALFAMEERVRPFNKYLTWELEHHPLAPIFCAAESLVPRLRTIVATGDLPEQQALFHEVEETARGRGLGEVVDGWEPDAAAAFPRRPITSTGSGRPLPWGGSSTVAR